MIDKELRSSWIERIKNSPRTVFERLTPVRTARIRDHQAEGDFRRLEALQSDGRVLLLKNVDAQMGWERHPQETPDGLVMNINDPRSVQKRANAKKIVDRHLASHSPSSRQ